MTAPPKHDTAPASSSTAKTVIRVLLFVVLAYMIGALAYEKIFLLKTHEAKYQEMIALAQSGTGRKAEDKEIGPEEVKEAMGLAPSTELKKYDHYHHEQYRYHRPIPGLTYNIDVYYRNGAKGPALANIAHTEEEVKEVELVMQPAIIPNDPPEEDTKTDDKKKTDGDLNETTDDKKKTGDKKKTDEDSDAEKPETNKVEGGKTGDKTEETTGDKTPGKEE